MKCGDARQDSAGVRIQDSSRQNLVNIAKMKINNNMLNKTFVNILSKQHCLTLLKNKQGIKMRFEY